MKSVKDPLEYGTQLDFRLKNEHEIRVQEFWGEDNGLRAREYITGTELIKSTNYHRFIPIQRNRD